MEGHLCKRKQRFVFIWAPIPHRLLPLYDQLLEPEQAETIYILKGGPGCGKSSLMRRVAQAMEEKGASVEYIACSGDRTP